MFRKLLISSLARNLALKISVFPHAPGGLRSKGSGTNRFFCGLALVLSVLFYPTPARSCARQVSVKNGNIFVTTEEGQMHQISSTGLDSEPALSEDGTLLAFVREIKVPKPVLYGEPEEKSEIWLASCFDDWHARLILKSPVSDKAVSQPRGLVNFRTPQFSPDKGRIYFLVPGYSATTDGLFYVIRSNGTVHFLATALEYWVVSKGQWAGDLVLHQNPLTYAAGRIDIYYLFGPGGKQLGIVGLTEDNVSFFIEEFGK